LSRLQVSFSVNMLGLKDQIPCVLNLPQVLMNFNNFRFEVVTRRTQFELDECLAKLHLVRGLKIAVDDIDAVIELIKSSSNYNDALVKLMDKYGLDEIQTKAILDMKISKLTGLEVEKLQRELEELEILSEKLRFILEHKEEIYKIIKEEYLEILNKFGDERKSEISYEELGDFLDEDLIKKEKVVITISKSGYVKRIPLNTYKIQKRGGKGVIGATTREEDVIDQMYVCNSNDNLLLFTDTGKIHWLKAFHVPEATRTAKGRAVVNLVRLAPNEIVTSSIMVSDFDPNKNLIFSTKSGLLKKTSLKYYSKPRSGGITAINLMPNDSVVKVLLTDGSDKLLLASRNGLAVKCKESDVRSVGRNSKGVRGIRLNSHDYVVDFMKVSDDQDILTITENGYGKRTKSTDYRLINRGGKGVINIVTSPRNGNVCAVRPINGDESILLISKNGILIGVKASDVSTIGRNTQGVRIMKLSQGDVCISVTSFKNEDENMDENLNIDDTNVEFSSESEDTNVDVEVKDNELELDENDKIVRDEDFNQHHAHSENIESGDKKSDDSETSSDDQNYSAEDEESFDESNMDRENER
ncbi:DNA gyrase subunit A, partial [Candidatus Woesearchaeota archaeon]|nr:DNA gyrase subunit A [Candidatus Woesearchaeota archaeon]